MSDMKSALESVTQAALFRAPQQEGALETTTQAPQDGAAVETNGEASSPAAEEVSEKTDRPRRPLIQGFVRACFNERKEMRFRDLLVPGKDFQGNLRNRVLLLDKMAPDWFKSLINTLAEQSSPMMVRVRVVAQPKDHLAYITPCARDEQHAKVEWERYLEEQRAVHTSLEQCTSVDEVAQFVYRKIAADRDLTLVKYYDGTTEGRDAYTALMINHSGGIYRVRGADEIYNFTDGIIAGTTTLDDEIERNVMSVRARYLD